MKNEAVGAEASHQAALGATPSRQHVLRSEFKIPLWCLKSVIQVHAGFLQQRVER